MSIIKKMPCIELVNVSYRYDTNLVLDNISFKIEKGSYVGVIGPNGGGKTTLMKIILGLLKPTSGKVFLFGASHEKFCEHSSIGYVPQRISSDLYSFPATVEEVVCSGRTARIGIFNKKRASDNNAIEYAMEITRVSDLRKRRISELSGGERQRVFIARALACEPEILILDEPSVGIDPAAEQDFYSFLRGLNKVGFTILFVSHDIDVVAHETKCILCLNKKLVCQGLQSDVLDEKHLKKIYGRDVRFVDHKH